MEARRYNQNKRKWSLLHFPAIEELIKILEFGAFKYTIFINKDQVKAKEQGEITGANLIAYHGSIEQAVLVANKHYHVISTGRDNWKKGLPPEEILESGMRHIVSLMEGEIMDEESKLHHAAHAMCNMMFYMYYVDNDFKENKHE